ncbi:MAG: hypothetical protein AAFZ65_00330 [Planctomycetota bacterium]
MLRLPALACLALFAAPATADLVVLDGDSLVDAVAQASDGETIFIQSEGTFVGTLAWSGKTLRIQQGFGFGPPTIAGDPDEPALEIDTSIAGTGAILEGLVLEGGSGAFPSPSLVFGGSEGVASIDATDCEFRTALVLGGSGSVKLDLGLTRCELESTLSVGGIGTALRTLDLRDCDLRAVTLQPSASSEVDATLADCTVRGLLWARDVGNDPRVGLTARRCRFEDRIEFLGDEDGDWRMLLESCLHVGSGFQTGITSSGNVETRGVNLTVTGFETGIYGEPGATWSNLLLFDNGQDLSPVVLPFQIDHSLISDGTYAGQNGNIAGQPEVDEHFALQSYSVGVDAGDKGAANIGDFDLNGDKRLQDGDGDGVESVSMGAVESHPELPAAMIEALPSSGTNLELLVGSAPVVGDSSFELKVAGGDSTIATLVALGTPTAAFLLPGFEGELLLALDQPLVLDLGQGSHPFPIPFDADLFGVQIGAQAIRFDQAGAVLKVSAANGLLLTLGA